MQENILIKAASDFAAAYRDVDRLNSRIDSIGDKRVKLTIDVDTATIKAEIDNIVTYATRAFQSAGKGTSKSSGLLSNLFDPKLVQQQIKQIEGFTSKLKAGVANGQNFNPVQLRSDIATRLNNATTQAEIARKSITSLAAELQKAETEGVQLAAGFGRAAGAGQKLAKEMAEVQKNIASAAKEKEKFNNKIQGRIDSGRAINPKDEIAFNQAEADLDNYIKKLAELQRLQQSSVVERIESRLSSALLEQSGAEQEIKRLNDIQAATEKLFQTYTKLGRAGTGIEVTKSGLQGQLAIINELISNSELYNKNEQERISLFQAQQRILQGTRALTFDLIKANQELYDLPARRQNEKGITPTIRDAFGKDAPDGFQSADDLIQKYTAGARTGLREGQLINTREGINAAIAELKLAQENVELFGDKFRALGFIIEQLEGRLSTALRTPIIQAGNAADELVQKLKTLQSNTLNPADRSNGYRQVLFEDGTYRGRGGTDEGSSLPREVQVRASAARSAIVPYDASFAIAQTRQLITLLDSLGAYTPPSLSLKGLDQIGSASGVDRQIRVQALDPNAGTGLEGLPFGGRKIEDSSAIVKYDAAIASQNKAMGDAIDLTQRLTQERQKLSKALTSQKRDTDFTVQAGTIDEIERLSKTTAGIPARIDLIVKAAKELAPQFAEGSEEAQRLLAVIDELSSKKSSPFFDLKSLDSYSGKIAELRRQIGSSNIGSDEFLAASRALGYTEIKQLDESGASFKQQQLGKLDELSELEQQTGSREGAIRKVFGDFGTSAAGIEKATSKLAQFRDAMPLAEAKAFGSLVDTIARALGLAGEAGLKGFGANEAAIRKAQEAAQRYNRVLGNLRTGAPVTKDDLSFARNRARGDLAKAVPGSEDARKALSDINKVDFSDAIGNLRNLELKGQELANLDIGTPLVADLKRIADGAKDLPGIYAEVKKGILSLKDAFTAAGGPGLEQYNNLISTFEKPKKEGPETEVGSLKAYNEAVNKSRELAEKAAVGTLKFSQNIEQLAKNTRVATAAQREFDKVLSKDSANESAQNLKELQDSGLGLEDFIDKQFEGTPNNRTGVEGRIKALKDQFGDLDFDLPGLEIFKGEYQQTLANLQQRLDSVSFQNIESDPLDPGQLFKDVFSRGVGGNQPGLLASFQNRGFAGLRQRAAALSPGSRRGLSEALIGGGFPLLFGQGPLAAGGGLAGGLLGPALLGGGGGFAGSIVGTAIGQAFADSAAAALELGKALLNPAENLSKLAETAALSSASLQGFVEGVADGGRKSDVNALVLRDLAENNPRALQSLNIAAIEQRNRFGRGGAPGPIGNLIAGAGASLVGIDQLIGDVIDNSPKFLGFAGRFLGDKLGIPTPVEDLFDTTISEAFGGKDRNRELAKTAEGLAAISKSASELAKESEVYAARVSSAAKAVAGAGEINSRVSSGTSELTGLRSQADQIRFNPLERAKIEGQILQKQKEITQESKVSLATQISSTENAKRELGIQKQLLSVGPAGRSGLEAALQEQFQIDGARQAADEARKALEVLNRDATLPRSQADQEAYQVKIRAQQEIISLAEQELAIAEKTAAVRLAEAKSRSLQAQDSLRLAGRLAGEAGVNAENIREEEAFGIASRNFSDIQQALFIKPDPALKEELRAAGFALQEAGISMADNLTNAAGEAANRFLAGLQADNSLGDALFAANAIQKLPPGSALGAIRGNEIRTGAQNQILSAGQALSSALTALLAAQDRAAASGGTVSAEYFAAVENSGKNFAETVVRAGNDVALSLNEAVTSLANSSNNAGRAILDPKASDIFGGAQRQLEVGAPLINRAFEINLDRFQRAFGFQAYPLGGQPLTLQGKADASDTISDLVSKIEQVQQSQALVTALTDATTGIQSTAATVVEGLNNLAGKNWEVNVLVNGQSQAPNLG